MSSGQFGDFLLLCSQKPFPIDLLEGDCVRTVVLPDDKKHHNGCIALQAEDGSSPVCCGRPAEKLHKHRFPRAALITKDNDGSTVPEYPYSFP